MGWNPFKKIKLPKIKLPSLKSITSSGLGKILDTSLKSVGEIAMQNAPQLLSFATTFMPAGSLLSAGMKMVAGQLGASPEVMNAVPALPPGVTPAKPEVEQFVVDTGLPKWQQTSAKLAPMLGKTRDEMWGMVKEKFRGKGIQALDLLEAQQQMDESVPLS